MNLKGGAQTGDSVHNDERLIDRGGPNYRSYRRDDRPLFGKDEGIRQPYSDASEDSQDSDPNYEDRHRRPKNSNKNGDVKRNNRENNDRPSDDRHRPRRRPPSDRRQRERSYSPPHQYEDPWDKPGSANIFRPLKNEPYEPMSGRPNERRNSPTNSYDDPWDIPRKWPPIHRRPHDRDYEPYKENRQPNKHHKPHGDPNDNTTSPDHEYDNSEDISKGNRFGGKYTSENGHITVDLGPGVYKPVTGKHPPPHHSRSKDNTPFPSKGSMLDADEPSDNKDDTKLVYGEDENEERGNWSGRFDFILSMLGYAVGLGNVWRFPYLCYRNGGGAFLFPFLLMMVVIGLPLFYLEASLGQYSSCGAMTCWHFAPLFKGLGIAMVMVSAMTGIYYNMILGWSLHYMFSSFTSDLPFASCDNDWNTPDCKLKLPIMTCEGDAKADDGRCMDEKGNEVGLWNKTVFTSITGRMLQSPSKEYWERNVLDFSEGIEYFGQPKWDLVLCLMLAWVICFFCLMKGIKTTGKVVYFTAIFPYVVLIILFFRGVTLDNASAGINYFITPDFARLADANVWKDAANQIFFSMSIAGGGLITLSSYNRFHNNILRDSLIVAFGDSGTCVLGGFVIFSYLGYMAGQLEVDVKDVAADGAGLAFVVYPEAVSSLPPSTLWALLFFVMLLTLGLDSQFAMIETVLTGVLDQYPKYRPKKTFVILIICIILFILGLPLTTPGGMYLLQLMDNYVGGMTLIIIGFFELVAIIYIYGANRFCQDIHMMTGNTQFLFWKVMWCVLSPLTILFIFIFMFIDLKASTYDDYTYPAWADALGWMFTLASVLAIPIVMLIKLSNETEGKNLWQKIRLLCLPSVYWGPALKKHREKVDYVDGFLVDPDKDLQPRTTFVNYGFDNSTDTLKAESQTSLGASRFSMISTISRGTAATTKSEKSGISFETSV